MEEQTEIKVLLVDDHKMIRDRLRNAIDKEPSLQVIGEASNGQEAIVFAENNVPDVIVMDVGMPVMSGVIATNIIISNFLPNVKIIGLSVYEIQTVKEEMLRAGASAYITKDEASDKLCATIRKEAMRKRNHQ